LAATNLEELGARPALTRVLADLGRALAKAGRDEEAADVLRQADELTRTMGMKPEPAAF
jgi:Flp pilus assembly protein TadD